MKWEEVAIGTISGELDISLREPVPLVLFFEERVG